MNPQFTKYENRVPLCSNTQPTSHSQTAHIILPNQTFSDAGLDLTLNPEFNKMAAGESRDESSSESSSGKLPVRIVYDNELTDKDSITVFEFDFEVQADISVSLGFKIFLSLQFKILLNISINLLKSSDFFIEIFNFTKYRILRFF